MQRAELTAFDHERIEYLSRYLVNIFPDIEWNIDNELIDTNLPSMIIDIMQKVDRISLTNETLTDEDVTLFNNTISDLYTFYQKRPDFLYKLRRFLSHRKSLRNKLISSYGYSRVYGFIFSTARLLGYITGILNLLNLGGNLLQCFKIPVLLASRFRCQSYFRFHNFLIFSFVEYLIFKYTVNHIINILEEDKRLCVGINLEKKEMQSIVAELFSKVIDEKVISYFGQKSIHMCMKERIFATVLFSNMNRDLLVHPYRNKTQQTYFVKLLCQNLLFCRTAAARIWYKSMLLHIYLMKSINSIQGSEETIRDIETLENELFHLKVTFCTLSQPVEDIVFCLAPLKLPAYALFGLYSLCIFNGVRQFKYAKLFKISHELKEIASHCKF